MKTITTSLCILAGTCLIAAAEGKPDKPHHKGPPPEMFKKFDTDGDGKLSDDEKKAMREAMEKRHWDRIKEFDTDGDGKLSDAEREKMHEARKSEWLKKFDTDGDGKLSEEEREKMKEDRKGKGKGGPGPGGKGKGKGGPGPGKHGDGPPAEEAPPAAE